VGDALEKLPELEAEVDFVLIDLWKDLYQPCFELVYPKLSAEAVIVADNMLFPIETRESALAYQKLVRSKGALDSMLLPIGSGLELSRKRGTDRPS
jgi:predicted O-methyltransferase YrrM